MENVVLESWLPQGDGENLFQEIKKVKLQAEAKGIDCFNLGVGAPPGAPVQSARDGASEAILSGLESMHEYQDNGEPGMSGFAKSFIRANVGDTVNWDTVSEKDMECFPISETDSISEKDMECFPIPGIKSMIGLIPLACGCFARGPGRIFEEGKLPYPTLKVMGMTDPGYPVPQTWAERYLGNDYKHLTTNPENNFVVSAEEVAGHCPNLLMLNYPHNPSGQISTYFLLTNLLHYLLLDLPF